MAISVTVQMAILVSTASTGEMLGTKMVKRPCGSNQGH